MADRFIQECIQVNLFGRYQGLTDLEHVFHVRSPLDPPDYASCLLAATTVQTWANTVYRTVLPTDILITRIVATSIVAVNAPQAEVIVNTPGIVSGDIAPASQTLCIKKAGTTRGRRRRGRWYTWPTIQGDTIGNLFNAGYVGAVVTALNQLLTALDTAGVPMVVGSLTDEKMWDVATFVAVDRTVDTQSRRGAGRGR